MTEEEAFRLAKESGMVDAFRNAVDSMLIASATRERPSEDDAEAVAYGASGNTIAEAMRMPDGTKHFTVVTTDTH